VISSTVPGWLPATSMTAALRWLRDLGTRSAVFWERLSIG
jgi:hypothetical protein